MTEGRLTRVPVHVGITDAVGGVSGIGVGWAASSVIGRTMQWSTPITADAVLLAFGCAAGIGVFFGCYPARTAARLNPIAALRYE